MFKTGIDQDAIVKMFTEGTAKQGEALRKAVSEATLKALQGRELTMENIKKVLKTVTTAATAGAAQNAASPVDVESMLTKALAGMDGALLQTVEAHRKALQQFVDQGVGLREKQLKTALANLEKMEDTFFDTVTKAVQGAGNVPMQGPWDHVLGAMKTKGTDTGAQATKTVEELMAQTRSALRDGRAAGAKTAQAMLDGYAALVSGVLIGMSQGLQGDASSEAQARSKKK
jgi:hypothetical protein